MTPRALLSWAGIFSLVVAVAGGCDRREPTPAQRAPRVVGSSAELFALDEGGTAKDERVLRELVGDWTPPAAIETVRPRPRPAPAPSQKAKRVEVVRPNEEGIDETRPQEEPAPTPPPRARTEAKARPAETAKPEPRWQTLPAPRNARADAMNASIAIGAIAVGMGSAVAAGDGRTGDQTFAIGCLGVGVASFGTALVLYLTEPDAKPAATTARSVTVTPLGVHGTF